MTMCISPCVVLLTSLCRTLFHRFDFSGDGHLDEKETLNLIQYMLRVHRDLQRKRSAQLAQRPHAPDFTANSIPFKQASSGIGLG